MFVWSFFKWIGRVLLWVLFFPAGLWRSIRHSQGKRDRAAARRERENAETIAAAIRDGRQP